jgi:outer membrane protein OmpA-like peptidoglycan-associated protein
LTISGRVGLLLFEPLSLQVSVTEAIFPSTRVANSLNTFYLAGLRLEPRTVAPEGRLFVEAGAGFVQTGINPRAGLELGVGWELAVTRALYLGPVVRYVHIFQPDDIPFDDPRDAHYLSLSLVLMLRPSPPPQPRQGSLLAINPLNLPDADYDGVPDVDDQCPLVVEDHDGFQDDDGCPDLDDDNDGIPDVEDRCPRDPETVNNYEDEDGCADTVPAQRERIEFRGDQLRLQQRVYYTVERVRVPAGAQPILTELARFLEGHPELRRLRVEGHADDRGTRRHGLQLSLRRAQAVVAFLVERGVDPARLEPVGYGDLRPLGELHDEVTRAGNRRIEFVIADGPAGVAPPPPPEAWTPRRVIETEAAPATFPGLLGDEGREE